MKKLLIVFMLFLQSKIFAQNISPLIAGQSYYFTSWATPTAQAVLTSSTSGGRWVDLAGSGATLIRVGGAQYNKGGSKPGDPDLLWDRFYHGFYGIRLFPLHSIIDY
jgi:hypothetical protein